MKIAICARTWGEKGGIGVYTRNLLRALLPLAPQHEFLVLYYDRSHVGQFKHLANVQEIATPVIGKFLWDQVLAPYYAAKHNVDVIFHPKMSVPLLSRCKTVLVLHGSERFVYPQFSPTSDILYFRTLYKRYVKRATAIIVVSDTTRNDIVRFCNVPPEKITTIHLAHAGYFRKINDRLALAAARKKYRLPERFILHVGLLYPGKNIPNLLRALKRVREHVDIKLVLAGTGRRMYEHDLELIQQLELQEHVLLPGYIPHEDLVAVYNLATVVVFPSFYESFGLINVEANASGCPLVTSHTGGSPEAAGEAALYIDPSDDESIANAVMSVLTDPNLRRSLVEKGFQNANRYSWERTARETLRVIESLGN